MTPFAGFLYFGILLYLAVPVMAFGLLEVWPRRYLLAVTLVMVALQYGLTPEAEGARQLGAIARVAGFAIAQWGVAAGFLALRTGGKRPAVFHAAAGLALLPLILVKLFQSGPGELVAFVGISYTTFRALDVIFCIQDGLVKDLPGGEYLAYLLFFPAISAGPIDRYRRFRSDYRKARTRAEFLADLDAATQRIFRGILYSFVVGALIQHYWLEPAQSQYGLAGVTSYMYAYSLHLFFDFAGYSAFAIGVGYVLGVRMPENFNQPFRARTIVEFWNRWHITLSSFLRDHVYGRFVLLATRRRWFKDGQVASYLGSILAFGLMGLWHGTAARYLFYGFYHALLIVVHGMLTRRDRPRRLRLPPLAAELVTFHAVCFGFLIFSGRIF